MIKRHYLDNGHGGQIHFADAGSGIPILFLHQTPRSWDEFREVIALLESRAYCVAIDLPGMGASDPITEHDKIEDYADAVIRLIEHLNLGPVVVCGHHTGGVVAFDIAAKRPDLVSSLVLSSTPWIDDKVRVARKVKQPIDTVAVSRDGHQLLDLWTQRSPYYPENPVYLMRFMASALQSSNPAHGHNAITHYKMEKLVGRIDCPILVIEHSNDPFSSNYTGLLSKHLNVTQVEKVIGGMVPLEFSHHKIAKILDDWLIQQMKTN